MRIVVYGVGAVGGVVAGRLALGGVEVAGIARGAHLEAMAAGGLRLVHPDGEEVVRFPVAATPAELGVGQRDDDVVLLAMKGQDTGAALDALREAAPAATPIGCLQNGVANERAALRCFSNVYAIPVMLPATHLEPGVVLQSSSPCPGILDVGRYPTGVDDVAEHLSAAFRAGGFESTARPDVMRLKWSKLRMNLANALEAMLPADGWGDLYRRALAEAVACYEAAGVDAASREEELERRGDLISIKPIAGHGRGGGSSWQSVARGLGSIEVDSLNGEIVLLGRLYGVATPVNAALQAMAHDHVRRRLPARSRSVAEVEAWIAASE